MHTYSAKKWTRAMEISRVNKIPYIQFVESSGGDLRMGGGKGEGSKRGSILGAGHFAESGRTFLKNRQKMKKKKKFNKGDFAVKE